MFIVLTYYIDRIVCSRPTTNYWATSLFFGGHLNLKGTLLNINYCCGLFTDYISARVHYSRLCSTLVPSVACQTTEGKYLLLTILPTY